MDLAGFPFVSHSLPVRAEYADTMLETVGAGVACERNRRRSSFFSELSGDGECIEKR